MKKFCIISGLVLGFCSEGCDQMRIGRLDEALRIAEDEDRQMNERVNAVVLIAKQQASGYIPRLGKLLQGRDDMLAVCILDAFATMGEPSALAFIAEYESFLTKNDIDISGKLNRALRQAKTVCSGHEK
jgi:hypothetical protein